MTTNRMTINLDKLPVGNYVVPPTTQCLEVTWQGKTKELDVTDMNSWVGWNRISNRLPTGPCIVHGDKLLVCMLPKMILGTPEHIVSLERLK